MMAEVEEVVSTPTGENDVKPKLDSLGRAYSTGKRKDAVARVWIKKGSGKIIIVDDVLATGGTLMAVNQLCEEAGYEIAGNLVLVDLEYVPRVVKKWPQNKKDFDLEVKSLIQYGKELG